MGGPLANFAGLLHMTMHSLTKSAIFFAVGHIAQVKGTQKIADIRGLTETHPVLGWGLVLGVVAIAGLPPLGIFMSEFLIVTSTFAREPLLAILLVFGLLVALRRAAPAAQRRRLRRAARQQRAGRGVLRADVRASRAGARGRHLPAAAARRLVPERRAGCWGRAMREPIDLDRRMTEHGRVEAHRPWPRVDRRRRRHGGRQSRGSPPAMDAGRPLGRARPCTWRSRRDGRRCRRGQPARVPTALPLGRRAPSARDAPRARDPRPLRPRAGGLRPTRGRGSTTAAGASRIRSARAARARAADGAYAFLPVEGESLHQIPVGPVHAGIIEPGHFRFTANGETVVRLEERLGYVHKGIEGLMAGAPLERARASSPARVSGDSTVAYAWPLPAPSRPRSGSSCRRARCGCAR